MTNITRNQAIEIAGEDAVHALEGVNCQPTGRVGFNGACQGDELCEWASSLTTTDTDGDHVTVRAYYFTCLLYTSLDPVILRAEQHHVVRAVALVRHGRRCAGVIAGNL